MPQSKSHTPPNELQAAATTHEIKLAKGRKFIVVSGNAPAAQTMSNWLEALGGETECFRSAENALLHTNIQHADYFIVDQAPGGHMNGLQLLNLIRLKLGEPISAVLINDGTPCSADELEWPVLGTPVNMPELLSSLAAQSA
jgi:CheY-like chemotaxis protein